MKDINSFRLLTLALYLGSLNNGKMNVGLLFTPVSIYQMTRGALVLWVGVFSVMFLHRSLYLFQWLSLVTVMLGVCIVGLSGTLLRKSEPANVLLHSVSHTLGVSPEAIAPSSSVAAASVGPFGKGDEELPEAIGALFGVLLILFAQIFTASQFVLEEKIMSKYSVEPLLAVGYEGMFGLVTTLSAQVVLHFLYGRTREGRGGYFDMAAGWSQIINTPTVLGASFAIALSIALFNFFGLSVTRSVSATARSTIDTCRTLGIWVVSLTLGWEVFRPMSGGLQILGFVFLCYGTLVSEQPQAVCGTGHRSHSLDAPAPQVFNNVVRPPKFLQPRRPRHLRRGTSHRSNSNRRRTRSQSQPRTRSRSRPHPSRSHSEAPPSMSSSMPSLPPRNSQQQQQEQQEEA